MDKTIQFSSSEQKELNTKILLREIYEALEIKGYDPIGQIVGYILTEDPTYITSYNDARKKIRKIDRDELLKEMVRNYMK